MILAVSENLKLWRVVALSGGLLSGHDTEEQAIARCADANASAEALGIAIRYKVIKTETGE